MKERLPSSLKKKLFLRDQGCVHPEGCNVRYIGDLTIDHFTSRCIATLLGWKRKQVNAMDNLQLLCWNHHAMKDSTTSAKRDQILFQEQGGTIYFGQHQ